MATFNKFYAFVADVMHGGHNFSTDQLKVALCSNSTPPLVTDTDLASLTEIDYTYLSPRELTTTSSSQTAGQYKLVLEDLVLTSAGGDTGPFQHVVIYNDTSGSKLLVGWYSYASEITLLNGETFTLDFSAATGAIQLS